jgi:NADH-quinone oxidoreductase subunit J
MTGIQLVFIVVAVVTLGAALMAVLTSNMVHAALWLILALFGVAVIFVLLSAGFLAVVQVVIYIGAISIIMIFAIMLTRRLITDIGTQTSSSWPWAALIAVALFGGLTWMLSTWGGFNTTPQLLSPRSDQVVELGQALVSPNAFVIPFEVASVLLLAALIGSIIIAWDRK